MNTSRRVNQIKAYPDLSPVARFLAGLFLWAILIVPAFLVFGALL